MGLARLKENHAVLVGLNKLEIFVVYVQSCFIVVGFDI